MKYWIIVITSFVISNTFVCAGNSKLNDKLGSNDSIYKMELLKLEYAFFLAQTDAERYDALFQKVLLSFKNIDYTKALKEITRIKELDQKILQDKAFYDAIEILLFDAQLYNSCIDIINEDNAGKLNIQKSFIKSLCLNQESQYELFITDIRQASEVLKLDTSRIMSALQNYFIESTEKKSSLYQALLPGAGMIKEGELKEGMVSFLLNGIFVALPIFLFKKQLFFTAFSYGIMPFSKFYFGGIRHTKHLAMVNKEKKLEEIKQKNAQLLFDFYNQ